MASLRILIVISFFHLHKVYPVFRQKTTLYRVQIYFLGMQNKIYF